MTICVESYIGRDGGTEGVKLEEQVLITESGTEMLSEFPFEESLLAKINYPATSCGVLRIQNPGVRSQNGGPDF